MIIRKKITRLQKAPRVSSGIRLEGANSTANQECLASGDFYPDRTMVPLILQPFCSYTDANSGKSVENALPEVTDGNWYRLTSSNRDLGICEATKISMAATGTDAAGNPINIFTVVSTPGSADYGKLTIRENVPAGEEITYIFEATLSTDGSLIREFFTSRCDSIVEIPDIIFDNNPTALFDPLNGEQYFSINPSLTIDYPVVWKWMSYHELEGGWVDLCSTPLDWCIDKVGDGIKIDRFRMPDMILLKCQAEVTVGGSSFSLEKTVSHTRMMPPLRWNITRVGEIPEGVTEISPYAMIWAGDIILTNDKEVLIEWLNSSGKVIANGINPIIPLPALNADGFLDLRVSDRGGRAALIDNGELLTSQGNLLLTRSKV